MERPLAHQVKEVAAQKTVLTVRPFDDYQPEATVWWITIGRHSKLVRSSSAHGAGVSATQGRGWSTARRVYARIS